jgi:hypothetical protein
MFQSTTKSLFTSSTKRITSSFASKSGVFTSAYTPFITTTSTGISYSQSSIISGGLGSATLFQYCFTGDPLQCLNRLLQRGVFVRRFIELAELAETINDYL